MLKDVVAFHHTFMHGVVAWRHARMRTHSVIVCIRAHMHAATAYILQTAGEGAFAQAISWPSASSMGRQSSMLPTAFVSCERAHGSLPSALND